MGSSPYSIVSVVLFLLLGASCSVVVAFDGKLLSRICNGKQFTLWSTYDTIYVDLMNDLKLYTSESPRFDYYSQFIGWELVNGEELVERTLYGHGFCTENLDPKDCHDCIDYAAKEMFDECTRSIGAQIKLMDCRLRYENYKFNDDH